MIVVLPTGEPVPDEGEAVTRIVVLAVVGEPVLKPPGPPFRLPLVNDKEMPLLAVPVGRMVRLPVPRGMVVALEMIGKPVEAATPDVML